MYKSKCPACGSLHTVKNGKRNWVQLFKCSKCGYQFRNNRLPSLDVLWELYQERKQTVREIAVAYNLSVSTIKRRLQCVKKNWVQPSLSGGGYVNLDATYWGHNWGVMLALDNATGRPLYMAFIRNGTISDFLVAIDSIKQRGYEIRGIIIDGKQHLYPLLSAYKVQMCQFHMKQIIRRYLTLNPRLKAARALQELVSRLTVSSKEEFEEGYSKWKTSWHETLNRRSELKSGKRPYTHKRLRSAMHSLDFYLPYLFTYQEKGCEGMPNTNNKIEGTFTDLKKNLNTHRGMNEMNRKRFICGFFFALDDALCISLS